MARSACMLLFQVSLSCFLSWALRDETRFSLELNAEEVEGPCASFVMSKLKEIAGVEDPGARIGAVLADQAFLEGCCDRTEYDDFIAAEAAPVDGLPLFTEHTALVIVDMQRDFTEGSFAQPCWAKTGARFLSKMLETIEEAKAAGSLIIATKDFHPFNHCSFAGESSCMNKKDLKEESALSRYVNEFPSHCSFSMKGRYAMPQKASDTPFCQGMEELGVKMPFCRDDFVGADLEPRILQALAKCEAKQVEVVYKGFNPTYDSFSAMHHASSDEHERNNTGAFALEENRSRACHGKWEVNATCYPTVEQLKTTDGLRNFSSILMTRGIKKIVTVGLVYDYCVKETAIFTRENMPEMEVIVLSHLTRPSFDGKPGAPYTAALCDGRDLGNGFCSEGGGTKAAHQKVLADYKSNDVAFVREKQNQYVEDDSKQSQEDE